jgi:hypothetical protein
LGDLRKKLDKLKVSYDKLKEETKKEEKSKEKKRVSCYFIFSFYRIIE